MPGLPKHARTHPRTPGHPLQIHLLARVQMNRPIHPPPGPAPDGPQPRKSGKASIGARCLEPSQGLGRCGTLGDWRCPQGSCYREEVEGIPQHSAVTVAFD
jgi:hypothetical protein